jgi:streptogrisin C
MSNIFDSRVGRVIVTGAVLAVACSTTVGAANARETHQAVTTVQRPAIRDAGTPTAEDDKVSLSQDAELIAKQFGLSQTEAEGILSGQIAFSELTASLRHDYPDQFADAWTDAKDGYSRHVAVVGAASESFAKQVDSSGLEVEVHQGYPTSEAELGMRMDEVAANVQADLPPEATFSVTFDAKPGLVVVTVPEQFREAAKGVSAFGQPDVRVSYISDDIIGRPHTDVLGGGKMMISGNLACTSGFTVATAGGTQGVATAGHCRGLDEYHGPAGNSAAITFQDRYQGTNGDDEWYTTPGNPDLKEFYWDFGATPRPVNSVVPEGGFNRGDYYCGFGRTTGEVCGQIRRVNASCTYSAPDGFVGHMIQLTTVTHAGGDSGGPWFLGNAAAGMDSGECTYDGAHGEIWSKANLLQEAMGVHVMQN